MSDKSQSLKVIAWDLLLTVVLPLAVVFGTEPLYRDTLYQTSLDIAPDLQKMEEVNFVLKGISRLGKNGAMGMYLTIVFNVTPKPVALYITCGFCFCYYLTN